MQFNISEHHIECELNAGSGTIERLLRLIRVRGFHVNDMQLHYGNDIYKAHLALSGERALENLKAQLEKLVDVIHIEVLEPEVANETLLEVCA